MNFILDIAVRAALALMSLLFALTLIASFHSADAAGYVERTLGMRCYAPIKYVVKLLEDSGQQPVLIGQPVADGRIAFNLFNGKTGDFTSGFLDPANDVYCVTIHGKGKQRYWSEGNAKK